MEAVRRLVLQRYTKVCGAREEDGECQVPYAHASVPARVTEGQARARGGGGVTQGRQLYLAQGLTRER